MPTKINGSGEQQEYDESTGRYGESKTQWITTDRNYSKLQPKVVELDEDNELAKLIATSDESKYKVITEYIKKKYGGNFMMFPDGSFARIDNNDAKKLSYNADDKRAAEISVLSKLIENSFLGNITDLPNDEHGKFNRFKYYYVQTKYKGQLSYVCLNIGRVKNAKDEWHFYTITKKEPPPTH